MQALTGAGALLPKCRVQIFRALWLRATMFGDRVREYSMCLISVSRDFSVCLYPTLVVYIDA